MSNRDNFGGGFLAGALFGGVVGGVLGVLLSRKVEANLREEGRFNRLLAKESAGERAVTKGKNRVLREETMEAARRSLEDKIAQLNDAIDDVRYQLQTVNGKEVMSTEPISGDDM